MMSKQFLCNKKKTHDERPNVGGVFIRSKNSVPSLKGRVVNGRMAQGEQQMSTLPPRPSPSLRTLYVFCAQVTGFVRVVLPLLKPATFCQGDMIITPKIGTREMGFIVSGEVEVRFGVVNRVLESQSLDQSRYDPAAF